MAIASRDDIEAAAISLGIREESHVEKDYYAIQTLRALSTVQNPVFDLVFAGGTAMTKVHADTRRMSEDVDIKVVLREDARDTSITQQRKQRKELKRQVEAAIAQTDGLTIVDSRSLYERRYMRVDVGYPAQFEAGPAITPSIKLELVHLEDRPLRPPSIKAVSSFIAQVSGGAPEVDAISTVDLHVTLAEKMVALTRRTADQARQPNARADSETLVRHAYDLHVAHREGFDFTELPDLVAAVAERDLAQFGQQHPAFVADPIGELRYGLERLTSDPLHRDRYEQRLVPLIYHSDKPAWSTVVETLSEVYGQVLEPARARLNLTHGLRERGEAAIALLNSATEQFESELRAPIEAERRQLKDRADNSRQALLAHERSERPRGLLSGNAAKAWDATKGELTEAHESNRQALRQFDIERQRNKVDLKVAGEAVTRAEAQHPQAVKDREQWLSWQSEQRRQARSGAQKNERSGGRSR